MLVPPRTAACIALAGSLLATAALAHADGLDILVSYTSPLDNSTQVYGVYVPHTPAPSPAGYPAILHAHGYGWSVSDRFSDFQKQWADDHGWILINVNARGPQFYEGVGDVETREVIRDANRRFGLDRQRIFITGGSMGGTGAYREGIRYPNIFAAAAGVDGWTDYRNWHYHWYARADMRDAIEEFRRPLLEACSPLYWAGRARWNSIHASVSGRDTTVYPNNGLSLYNKLLEDSYRMPGAYDTSLYLDYTKGHCGSTRLDQIYNYFASRSLGPWPASFRCESTLLVHGAMYWGRMDRLKVQGAKAVLESDVSGNTVSVITNNLSEFTLYPQASPAGGDKTVKVFVDGFPCYRGAPRTLNLRAAWSPTGALWGWAPYKPSGWHKSEALEGPLGEAFKVPFTVVYGTAGSPAETARNRREAEDFARGWNAFMVHGPGVTALPEERLEAPDLRTRSLVIFGTESSSRLLSMANDTRELPVHIRDDRIVVRDPRWGDRSYIGPQYGAFLCYPNPLTDGKTYLVVCHGQWATRPDGTVREGLEYDLEKLPWAYPDYVVFDTDQAELPRVQNVNNKPPVTCYEAAYFVEAGYFDQDWRPYRAATLDRVKAEHLPTPRIHVAQVAYGPVCEGMPGTSDQRIPGQVSVWIVDSNEQPVPQARVTVRFASDPLLVRSGVTGQDGVVLFSPPPGNDVLPPCSVVNVMATGAVYDWQANEIDSTTAHGLVARVSAVPSPDGRQFRITAETGGGRGEAHLRLVAPGGQVSPPAATMRFNSGTLSKVIFFWDTGNLAPGRYPLQLVARRDNPSPAAVSRRLYLTVGEVRDDPLIFGPVTGTDIAAGSPYQVQATLLNQSAASTFTVRASCSLIEAGRFLPAQTATLAPGARATLTWKAAPGESPLPPGKYHFRIVTDRRDLTAGGDFTVK